MISDIHLEHKKIYGYRRMTLKINKELATQYNHKRIRRIMRRLGLYSVIRRPKQTYVRANATHISENILNRQFDSATAPNQIWCTDVTEFKCTNGEKVYLSAVIDLWDKSIVAYQLSNKNNNQIVMSTIHKTFIANPNAQPMIHSDRGFQYTSHAYRALKSRYQFKVSMSRVAKCLDNQPIESFWGTLKSECFYLNKYQHPKALIKDIEAYIRFYNYDRITLKYNGLTPIEIRNKSIA